MKRLVRKKERKLNLKKSSKYILSFSENFSKVEDNFHNKITREEQNVKEFQSKFSNNLGRISFFHVILAIICMVFLYKAWKLQIVEGKKYRVMAEGNRIRFEIKDAPRGIIFDSNKTYLVRNIPGLKINISPYELEEEKLDRTLSKLSEILDKDKKELEDIINEGISKSLKSMTLKSNINHDQEIEILTQKDLLPGVSLEESIIREYNYGEKIAHVTGYTGDLTIEDIESSDYEDYFINEKTGKTGIELYYEKELRGVVGQKMIEVDSQGEEKDILYEANSLPGYNLILNIDSNIQIKAYDLLAEGIKKYGATGGAIVIQEVGSGKILTILSENSYDPNLFAKGISSQDYSNLVNDILKPLFNRAISGEYPCGSTIKPLVGAAALEEGIISEKTLFDDKGVMYVGDYRFPDWKLAWGLAPNGPINVIDAISQSCDTFFYTVGGGYGSQPGLGIDKLKDYALRFGFSQTSGIDLPGESNGLYPDPLWKEEVMGEQWFLGDTYWVSIGQSYVLTTPLQINNYINSIANGGILFKPQIVNKVVDINDNLIQEYTAEKLNENFISKTSLDIAKEGMRKGVSEGILWPLRDCKYQVAAKTGTAEFGVKDIQGNYETHAWVTGFFPYNEPEISFTVFLESGGQSNNAAEIARDLVNWYFDYKTNN